MNIAIYARVSSDIQAEQGYSLAAQVEDCKRKAEELGAGIVKEYIDDGYSGAYLERPALDALREALRQKMFAAVICWDVDRLSRNLSHQLSQVNHLDIKRGRFMPPPFCFMQALLRNLPASSSRHHASLYR